MEEEEEAVEVEEVEIVNVIQQRPTPVRVQRITEVSSQVLQPDRMDTRYFGELLADVYRKNCDIHTCISEHVAKIRGKSVGLLASICFSSTRDLTTNCPFHCPHCYVMK